MKRVPPFLGSHQAFCGTNELSGADLKVRVPFAPQSPNVPQKSPADSRSVPTRLLRGVWLLLIGPAFAGFGAIAVLVLSSKPFYGAPLIHPARITAWWSAVGSIIGVFALMQMVFIIAALYWFGLALINLAVLVLRSLRAPETRPAGSVRHLPGYRRMARALAGTSLAGAALFVGTSPSVADTSGESTGDPTPATTAPTTGPATTAPTIVPSAPDTQNIQPRLIPLDTRPAHPPPLKSESPGPEPRPAPTNGGPAPTPSATPSAQPAPTPSSTPATSAGPTAQPAPAPALGPAPAPVPSPATTPPLAAWTVRPGDDLWSIAEAVMAKHLGQPPSDAQIGPYWLQVIAANRSRLPDPRNPGLIFAGEVITLPPL